MVVVEQFSWTDEQFSWTDEQFSWTDEQFSWVVMGGCHGCRGAVLMD